MALGTAGLCDAFWTLSTMNILATTIMPPMAHSMPPNSGGLHGRGPGTPGRQTRDAEDARDARDAKDAGDAGQCPAALKRCYNKRGQETETEHVAYDLFHEL